MKHLALALVLCVFFAVGCNGSNAGTSSSGNGSSSPVQGNGQPGAGGVTEADLGVPFYPGSTADASDGGDVKKEGTTHTTVASNHVSDDSADKVLAFYKGKLPTFEASKAGDADILTGKGTNGGEVAISITKDGEHSKIVIINTRST